MPSTLPLSLPRNWMSHFPVILMYSVLLSILFSLVYFGYGLDFFRLSFSHPFLFFSLYTFFIIGLLLEICFNTRGGFIPPRHDPVNFYFVFWGLSCFILFGFFLPLSMYYTGKCIAASLAFDEVVHQVSNVWFCTLCFGSLFLYTKHFTLDLNDIRRMQLEEKTVRTQSGKWEPVLLTQTDLERLSQEFKNSYEIRKASSPHAKENSPQHNPFPSSSLYGELHQDSPHPSIPHPQNQSLEHQERQADHQDLDLETSVNPPLAYPHISSSDLPQAFTLEIDDMSDLHPEWLDSSQHPSKREAQNPDQDYFSLAPSPSPFPSDLPPPPYYVQPKDPPNQVEHPSPPPKHQSFDTIGVACPFNEEFFTEDEKKEDNQPSKNELPDWFDRK